jgi:hypothetical protein
LERDFQFVGPPIAGQRVLIAPGCGVSANGDRHRLRAVANTIEGGISEIQRSIIATRGLGLPRQ